MTYNQKKNQSIETDSEKTGMIQRAGKNFKLATIKVTIKEK